MQPDGYWHSQQAAERALKAALVLEGSDFPFTHDLNAAAQSSAGQLARWG